MEALIADHNLPGTLYVFPGLGSEYPGMLARFFRENPSELAWLRQELGLRETERILEEDSREESGEEGDRPFAADRQMWMQKGIFAFSILQWKRIIPKPGDALAGHSLGFYAAAVASGALTASDALRVLTEVYELTSGHPEFESVTTWVLNGRESGWMNHVQLRDGMEIIAVNDPFQIVLCGSDETVARFCGENEQAIAKAVPVNAAAPIHSRRWQPTTESLKKTLADLPVSKPQRALWSHTTCEPLVTADSIREELCGQIARPVRWEALMARIREKGYARIHDMGPNKILRQMAYRFDPTFQLSYSDIQKSRKPVTDSSAYESKTSRTGHARS